MADIGNIISSGLSFLPGGNILGGIVGGLFSGGPDISQRVRDFNNYLLQGKVLGGKPDDDSTWIFNFDYMKNNPSDPWVGVLKDPRFIKNWNDYLAVSKSKTNADFLRSGETIDYTPLEPKEIPGQSFFKKYAWWIVGGGVAVVGIVIYFFTRKRKR